jgi:hypothetical protein
MFIMRGITKARATCHSFLWSAKAQSVKAQCNVVNSSGGRCNTTSAKPHEFFDHMGGEPARRFLARV